MISDSPFRSYSEASEGAAEQLESQTSGTLEHQTISQQEVHSDIEEKASLASHSNASVSSRASKSSRVSVASTRSSVHSHLSRVNSKESSQSSKSSRTSPDDENPSPSSSSHSLKNKESEVPKSNLSRELSKEDTEPGEVSAAAVAAVDEEYNYDDDKFEEEEKFQERDSEVIDPMLNKEEQLLSDNEPRETAADAGIGSNYEGDTFEKPEDKEEAKQKSEEHHSPEEGSHSPALVERNVETEETEALVDVDGQGSSKIKSVMSVGDAEDSREVDQTDSSTNTEDHKGSLQTDIETDSPNTVQPDSDGNTVSEPEDKDTTVQESIRENDEVLKLPLVEEPQASASEDKLTIKIKSGDATDTPETQQEKLGILVTSSKRKTSGLSVSFESGTQNTEEPPNTKDLSASQTIEEAKKMLQKSQSNVSLGSLMNDRQSSLDLSVSDDEDIPDLEQKISDLIDDSNSSYKTAEKVEEEELTREKAYKGKNTPTNFQTGESEDNTIADPAQEISDQGSSEVKTELQDTAATAEENDQENVKELDQGKAGESEDVSTAPQEDGSDSVPDLEEQSGSGINGATLQDWNKDTTGTVQQEAVEQSSEKYDKSQSGNDNSRDTGHEAVPQDSTDTFSEESEKQDTSVVQTSPDEEISDNSRIKVNKEAEEMEETLTAEHDSEVQGESQGPGPRAATPLAETANLSDRGSMESGLSSSSSSKSSLTSVTSQASQS